MVNIIHKETKPEVGIKFVRQTREAAVLEMGKTTATTTGTFYEAVKRVLGRDGTLTEMIPKTTVEITSAASLQMKFRRL